MTTITAQPTKNQTDPSEPGGLGRVIFDHRHKGRTRVVRLCRTA